ncbi:uncharacterized protein LOC143233640 [Tachypleus tridentatus]|uniref:uncharacterized protein LOC143233640 n=1 Tax=Tachypleus tridentatus TaxID=6853 RepID=UPI003FD611A1
MSEEGSSATSTPNHSSPFSAQFSTCSSTKSSVDSTDSQDMFPTASSRFILRPSPLAVQTEKLKMIGSTTSESQSLICTSHKHEDKENKCISDNTEQLGESDNSNGAKKQVLSSDTLRPSDDNAFKSLFKSECSKSSAPLELIATSGPTNFVFGQNLHERVVTYEDSKSDSSSSISNQLNFQAFQKSSSEDERQECTGKPVKSLTQSAEEYQARQAKRKYDEVTVVTGEEGESNVLQINCKLFAFEKNSSWVERGRGMLRLNDREVDGTLQSRLVMRTQGSLRLVLNTKVWAGMSLEQASHKTIRFSAVETDGVKVYLIMHHNLPLQKQDMVLLPTYLHHNLALQKRDMVLLPTYLHHSILHYRSRTWYFCLHAPQSYYRSRTWYFCLLAPQSSTAETGHGTFAYLHH